MNNCALNALLLYPKILLFFLFLILTMAGKGYSRSSRYLETFSPALSADEFLGKTWVVTLLEDKQMWYWDLVGKIWRPDAESYLMAWAAEEYPNINKNDYNELKFQIQKRTVMPPDRFKANPYFLNFNGKELNLRTLSDDGTVDVEHYIKKKLKTELDLKIGPPKLFLQCLCTAIPDGRDLYHCLQAFAALLLIRTMRIEKAFFFLGSGGNGKSTIMKAIENIFPGYIGHVDLNDLVKDRFSSAGLVDKLANVYADIQSLKMKDMAIFKAISSGDTISVGDKYERRHDETIKVIQIYSANKMPYIDDKNKGFTRRASPVVFDIVIKKLDPYIDDRLADPEERKKILAMLVRIARITKEYGFLFEKSEDEVLRIFEEKEDPITQFLNDSDWVIQDEAREIEKHDLYQMYLTYCKSIGCPPKQMNAFGRYLTNKGIATRRANGKSYAVGLADARTPAGTLI